MTRIQGASHASAASAARAALLGGAVLVLLLAVWFAWPHAAPAPRDQANGTGATAASVELAAGTRAGDPSAADAADAAAAPSREAVAVADLANADADAGDRPVAPWRVTARVLDDADEPVVGATVTVVTARSALRAQPDARGSRLVWLGADHGAPVQAAVTGSDGNCVLTFDRPRVHLAAWHPAFGRSIAHAVDCRRPPADGIVRLWLARPVAIQGTVFGAGGAPVPFATVEATLGSGAAPGAQARARYLAAGPFAADANGRFRVETVAGATVILRAQAAGAASPAVPVTPAADVELALLLPGVAAITGRVVDAAGAPVANRHVLVRRADVPQPTFDVEAALAPLQHAKMLAVRAVTARNDVTAAGVFGAVTGADGGFRVDVNTFAAFVVEIVESGVELASARVVVTAAQPRPHVDLRMVAAGTLCGRVRFVPPLPDDARDDPRVTLAVVAIERTTPFSSEMPIGAQAYAAPDGAFTVRVPTGRRWDLVARSGDREARLDDVGSPASGIDLVLAPPPARFVRGELERPDGAPPAAGVRLRWLRLHTPSYGDWWEERDAAAQWDGLRFTVPLPPHGAWFLVAGERDGVAATAGPLDGTGAEPVVLRPLSPATVPLRVVTAAGLPLRHLAVDVSSAAPGELATTLRTDDDGRCTLSAHEGHVTITVRRSCERLARRELDVAAGTNPELVLVVQP